MIPFNFYYVSQVDLHNDAACAKKHNRNYFFLYLFQIAFEQPTFFVNIFGGFNDAR